jgi:DNA-binding response OmpR family regulator
VKGTLERANFVVVTADDGNAALQLTGSHRPDVVVLDLNMPDVDGPEVLKQLRQRWESIPVLVFTGFPDGELMTRALESGPFTLLAKPCQPEELVATIRRLKKQEETGFWKINRHGRHPEPVVPTDSEPQQPQGDLPRPATYEENNIGHGRRQKDPQRLVAAA